MQPALKVMILCWVPLFLFCSYIAGVQAQQWEVAIGIPALAFSGLGINYLIDRGYRLSADGERLYMRDWGYKGFLRRHGERSIPLAEISAMEGAYKGFARAKAAYMPFELLLISSAKRGAKDIWIHPPSFVDRDIKDLLWFIHDRRPDIFPDYVLDYMRSERPL